MRWSLIRIEPADISSIRGAVVAHWYQMQLPLIADGRLVWSQLRLYPERALVQRLCKGRVQSAATGLLALLENQWTCVWSREQNGEVVDRPPDVRMIGAKFSLGDVIGMRPVGGALSLYRVRHRSLLPHGWDLAQCAGT